MAEQPGANYSKTLIAQASSGVRSDGPVDLYADKTTHRLLVQASTALVGASGLVVGQAKIAVTATAVQLTAGALTNGVIITANPANTKPISIGPSTVNNTTDGTGNGYILQPGASVSFSVSDVSVLYINGTAGDIVSWAGS